MAHRERAPVDLKIWKAAPTLLDFGQAPRTVATPRGEIS